MKRKFNFKYLLVSLASITILTSVGIGLYVFSLSKQSNFTKPILKDGSIPITSNNFGQQVGKIRHWQNNNFSGVQVKNNGFVVLTGTDSATRIDSFGNIIWEFDPNNITTDKYLGANDFAGKKVVEIVEDQLNSNVLYLLLVPNQAPDECKNVDDPDKLYYSQMIGSNNSRNQATLVKITENIGSYSGSSWAPSFTINSHINIDPQKMVDNYPSDWKKKASEQTYGTENDFFAKVDHPSWYINSSSDKISPATIGTDQSSTVTNETMVLPWKQYVTNLGNMYANNGVVLVFGGNGSIYNDPEALSIGVWKADFNTNTIAGIPYAYLLSGLTYDPVYDATSKPQTRWNWCYAPIGQTSNFHYVPRLAIGGIETNVSSNTKSFIYLAGGITVGQIRNSQTRDWKPVDEANTEEVRQNTREGDAKPSPTLQEKRSLQLSGQNALTNLKSPDRNSIDPCLLFGTALSIDSLINMPTTGLSSLTIDKFSNILVSNSYFDIGTNISYNSFSGTYYFFDSKRGVTQTSSSGSASALTTAAQIIEQTVNSYNAARRTFSYYFDPNVDGKQLVFGQLINKLPEGKYTSSSSSSSFTQLGSSKASYSYNLPTLVDNARNYYYPTLTFGYSLKSIGSLVKVQMPSEVTETKGQPVYGYAMQVGKSILFINEPKFDSTSIVYHAPSSISIGDNSAIGIPYYGDQPYWYCAKTWQNNLDFDNLPFSSCGSYEKDNEVLRLGVGEFVGGIKDLNNTVPYITSHFTIGNDPYASVGPTEEKATAVLPWNDFDGLSFGSNGSSLASLWTDSQTPTKDHLFLTFNPQLSEFRPGLYWTEFTYLTRVNDYCGEKQIWFETATQQLQYNNSDSQGLSQTEQRATTTFSTTQTTTGKFSTIFSIPAEYYATGVNETSGSSVDAVFKMCNDSTNIPCLFTQNKKSKKAAISDSGISYVTFNPTNIEYKINDSFPRSTILGQGGFINVLTDDILTNSLGSILETNSLSILTNDLNDKYEQIQTVKPEYVNQIFKVTQHVPVYQTLQQESKPEFIILASNVDMLKQQATFTAYSWNCLLNCYDLMPASTTDVALVSNVTLSGFSALASWILPVAIVVPILIIALVIGLGCAIGIPMHKHRKSLRVGFELQHQKLNTLTTAVGGVFKKIIESTDGTNMKSKPQMLKPSSSSKAASPASKPGSTLPPSFAKPANSY
ncbi:hypothetical protein [Mycoplasmoides alvi]|uniref:hypothetical protein n=1 Tax=Mycoplasmoides alvi TaxID=78580 RepID=UPI00051C60C8|nr:hypothetical protein [Mycoplasmoides alvi]